ACSYISLNSLISKLTMSYIFLNNKIVSEEDALVSVKDRGFLYGDGIFETFRSYDSYLFNIEKHFNRMKRSASCLKIPFNYSLAYIQEQVKELLNMNGLPNSYIRITLSRGVGNADLGFRISDYKDSQSIIPNPHSAIGSPTLVIQVKPLKLYPDELYNKGMSAIVSRNKISVSCPISQHKTSNFLTNIIVRDEADLKGAHEAVLLNTEDDVAECSASNLFIVVGDTVITPPIKVNILPGITRETVLEICRNNSICVREEKFGMDRLMRANECFLTNSIMEIMPVAKINGVKIGKSVPGMQTEYLMNEYKRIIKSK
ncbi:MAG: aminotransferase class IV, partial [Candidatus Anammoxibacter sp.]